MSASACPADLYKERKTSMKPMLQRVTMVLLSCSLGHASLSYAQIRSIEEYKRECDTKLEEIPEDAPKDWNAGALIFLTAFTMPKLLTGACSGEYDVWGFAVAGGGDP